MKQMLAGMAVVVAGLVVGMSVDGKPVAPGPIAQSPTTAIVKADLMTVWSAYRDNATAADARYGAGRSAEVTGPVVTVDRKDGEVCLFLFDVDLASNRPARARCLFAPEALPELARLLKMEKVTVRGRVSWEPKSMVGSAIVLQDCTLVPSEK